MKRSPAKKSAPMPQDLRQQMAGVMTRDRGRLLGQWQRLSRRQSVDASKLAALRQQVAASVARRDARAAAVPAITLDESLPITARGDEIIAAIAEHQVLVIAGETGSGKTTQLPKLCLAAGRGTAGLIGCTQPRRLAARSMARRVASELGSALGEQVGYQVRFAEKLGEDSLIKFMTDGILLAETRRDRWLDAYDTLIIDEAHERSLNIDFLLGYLKRLLRTRRDLKVIVTSATIDTARFAAHFDDAPVIEVEGRAYPVEVRWQPLGLDASGRGKSKPSPSRGGLGGDGFRSGRDVQQGSAEHIALALDEITHDDPRGDVLIFLPGEREIRDAHRLLSRRGYRHTEVLPLYARLSARDQDRVFNPGPTRRVVLATNVAETSLTVPRIRYVIDTGVARVMRYSQRSQIERLHVEPISRAAADQRKGRCGRVGPGVCVRLYAEPDFEARPRFTEPELLRSSLTNVILRMLDLGLGEVTAFPFLEPPEPRAIADGYRRLAELSAIDGKQQLTDVGREMARLPIDAQLARMLIEAGRLGVTDALLVIVAFLSVQDPRERPPEARGQADAAHAQFADPKSDFVGVLNLWQAYATAHEELTQRKLRDWCGRNFLSYLRMREWRELHRQLLVQLPGMGNGEWGIVKSKSKSKSESGKRAGDGRGADGNQGGGTRSIPDSRFPIPGEQSEPIHCALLSGFPTQIGRKDENGLFRSTRQRSFKVFPGSALADKPPNWIFAAQILDLGGKVWGMLCARIEPRWIEQQAAHLLRSSVSDPHWSRKRGKVVAFEQVSLFGLVLVERRLVSFHKQDPALAHTLFLEQALATCEIDTRAEFVAANQRVLDQAREREAKARRQGLLRDEAERARFFEGKLPESVSSRAALEKWYRKASPSVQAALRWSLDDVLDTGSGLAPGDYPAKLELGNLTLALQYRFVPGDQADGVTLAVPLALLNAVPAERCQWLVPGLLPDKVAALIKSLPKKLRRNFVPAPDFARAFCEAESPRNAPLNSVLAAFLKRTTGVEIDAGAFAGAELPAHLCMRFRLIGERGKTLAASRSLEALREEYAGAAQRAFSRQTDADLATQSAQQWVFDDIPEKVRSSGNLDAWPALVDLDEAVALRVFERADEAREQHRRGIERLLRLALAPAIKQARRKLPIATELGLRAVPLFGVDALREDLVEGALCDLLAGADLDVRERQAFDALCRGIEVGLFAASVERLKLIEPIIEAQAELRPWLKPPLMGFATASYDDLREQLEHLLPQGFARDLPLDRLSHLPRYLKAMRLRAERLRQDPGRDQQRMLDVQPYWRAYRMLVPKVSDTMKLNDLRWLVEEYRVSLFAQELGTAETVSAKRLTRWIQQVQAAVRTE